MRLTRLFVKIFRMLDCLDNPEKDEIPGNVRHLKIPIIFFGYLTSRLILNVTFGFRDFMMLSSHTIASFDTSNVEIVF